jgi:hypothetical protein
MQTLTLTGTATYTWLSATIATRHDESLRLHAASFEHLEQVVTVVVVDVVDEFNVASAALAPARSAHQCRR